MTSFVIIPWILACLKESKYYRDDVLSSYWVRELCADIESGKNKRPHDEIRGYIFRRLSDEHRWAEEEKERPLFVIVPWVLAYMKDSIRYDADVVCFPPYWLRRLCKRIQSGEETRTNEEIKEYVDRQMREEYEERQKKNDAMTYKHPDISVYTGAHVRDMSKEFLMSKDVKPIGYIGGNSR